jgi:glycosyltransferase involved in cell wall biosynthesis
MQGLGMIVGKRGRVLSGPLHVIVATPLGQGGRGGIDRVVDEVRHQVALKQPSDLDICFLTTRGSHHIGFAPIYLAISVARLVTLWVFGRVDVLHVNLSSHGSTVRKVVMCRVARALGIPYVVHLHGSRFRQFYRDTSSLGVREIVAMFRGAARIVVLGAVWQAFVAEHIPDVVNRIDVLPNATRAPDTIEQRRGGPVKVLFLGHVGPRKGIAQLLEAFASLAGLPGWTGIIAGDGRLEQALGEIKRCGLSDRVTITGWLGPADVANVLSDSNILVLPSFDENLPMSVIEAMGYGLAVVATPVGAVADIIEDGETGILVPVGDVKRLASALERLITDPELRERLGRQARSFHREHLNIDAYLPRLVTIWRAAAAASGTITTGHVV